MSVADYYPRMLALGLLLVAGVAFGPLSGCSSAGGVRPSSAPTSPSPVAPHPKQPFDLMPSSSLRQKADKDLRTNPGGDEATGGVRVSPDGKWVAFESERGGVHGVWIARSDRGGATRVSGTSLAVGPSWAPDGSQLAFFAREFKRPGPWTIWVVEMRDGAARRLASTGDVQIEGASWFPDSQRLCYAAEDRLVVFDTLTRATRALHVPVDGGRIAGIPAVSPDGGRIVFAVADDGVWIASWPDGRMKRVIAERDVDAFAWAPGGRQIAVRTARDGQWKLHIVLP
jgi:Tol biopolymer transport system component